MYNHIPGDGREFVCVTPTAVKVRAEDGRAVTQVGREGREGRKAGRQGGRTGVVMLLNRQTGRQKEEHFWIRAHSWICVFGRRGIHWLFLHS